jgi:hypothetical protein
MDTKKYIGMDVHQVTVSVAVMDSGGKINGFPYRNEVRDHSGVHPGVAWDVVGNL